MALVAGYVGKYFVKKENKDFWYYVLTTGKDLDGKRIQIRKRGFVSEKAAKKSLREAQVAADKGTYIKPSKSTFGEYLDEWFNTRKEKLGSQTVKANESYIRNHIIPMIGHISLADLNVLHIEKFISDLRKKGLAEATIKKMFSIVSSSLITASKRSIILKNVAADADNKAKVKRKKVEVWDELEARQFLEFVQTSPTRYYIAFHIALATGMRQGEILGLRWEDVDLQRKRITVKQTLRHDGKGFNPPKTESSIRSVTVDEDTLEALNTQKAMITKEKSIAKGMYVDKDLVVCTNIGTQCKPRDLDKIWNRLRNKAELRKITFHDLRHTHASLLLLQNIHPKVVSERLGHSSIQITLDLYSHLFANMQEDAATGLGKVLFQKQ